jgi:hypothetical protein
MSKSHEPVLGEKLYGTHYRDAVHIAIIPVIAGESLATGQPVELYEEGGNTVVGSLNKHVLGIVDPFIIGGVKRGEQFYLWLTPRTITSLRHVWTHPEFPEEVKVEKNLREASTQWLETFAERKQLTIHQLLHALENNGYVGRNEDATGEIPDEVWEHYENATGKRPPANAPSWFSCSC